MARRADGLNSLAGGEEESCRTLFAERPPRLCGWKPGSDVIGAGLAEVQIKTAASRKQAVEPNDSIENFAKGPLFG